jgi:hypothetical protein
MMYPPQRNNFWKILDSFDSSLGYSDYVFFKGNYRGSRVYCCKNSFQDTSVKHVFKNFEPFLAT